MPTTNTTETRRTADLANYALNRKPENRLAYAEQQVSWFYADLLKAQHGINAAVRAADARKLSHYMGRTCKAQLDLAEAHASLDELQVGIVG